MNKEPTNNDRRVAESFGNARKIEKPTKVEKGLGSTSKIKPNKSKPPKK